MKRAIFHIRALLASLIIGAALAFGLGVANAAPSPPCAELASVHHFDDRDVAAWSLSDGGVCDDSRCGGEASGCCSAVLGGGCCGLSNIAFAEAPALTGAGVVRSVWLAVPARSLAGVDPRVDYDPPRVSS